MAPCLSKRMLSDSLSFFAESDSGWGMDNYWWLHIIKNKYTPPIIIDSTPITHTRPVGSAGHGVGSSNTHKSPYHDLHEFQLKYNFNLPKQMSFAGKPINNQFIDFENQPDALRFFLTHDTIKLLPISNHFDITKSIWDLSNQLINNELIEQIQEILK